MRVGAHVKESWRALCEVDRLESIAKSREYATDQAEFATPPWREIVLSCVFLFCFLACVSASMEASANHRSTYMCRVLLLLYMFVQDTARDEHDKNMFLSVLFFHL